jgi:hypothetical protein
MKNKTLTDAGTVNELGNLESAKTRLPPFWKQRAGSALHVVELVAWMVCFAILVIAIFFFILSLPGGAQRLPEDLKAYAGFGMCVLGTYAFARFVGKLSDKMLGSAGRRRRRAHH